MSQVYQTGSAIRLLLAERPGVKTGQPLGLTAQDLRLGVLFKDGDLVASTTRWLRGAQITVVPLGAYTQLETPGPRQVKEWYFVATVRLASGTEITLAEKPAEESGVTYTHCDYRVRWPGAAQDEPLPEWWVGM